MKVLTKTKSLVFIIILLIITNVVLMVFFVLNNQPHERKHNNHDKGGLYTTLQKDVGFSDAQLKQYQQLRKEQFQCLKPLFNQLRSSKENFYNLLYVENPSDSLVNTAADSIGHQQKLLDVQMLSYFRKIRKTCTPTQLPQFDATIKKTLLRMTGKSGRTKH